MSPTFIRLEADLVVHRDAIERAHFTKNTNGVHAGWLDLQVRGEPGQRQYSGDRALEIWRVIAGLSLPSRKKGSVSRCKSLISGLLTLLTYFPKEKGKGDRGSRGRRSG